MTTASRGAVPSWNRIAGRGAIVERSGNLCCNSSRFLTVAVRIGRRSKRHWGYPAAYSLRPASWFRCIIALEIDCPTLSLRREVFANSVAGVDYTYKQVGNIWDGVEVNQIWDPTGTRVVNYFNGQAQQIFLFTRPDDNWRIYQGVDFMLESRPRQEWDFNIVYTLSWLYGPGSEQLAQVSGSQNLSQFYNRRLFNNFDGFLPEDHRHNLKIRASYTFKGLTIGTFLNYLSGAPLTKLFYNQNEGLYSNRRSPTGTEPTLPNRAGEVSELRLPSTLTVDTRISYDLQSLLKKVHLILIADVFNMFNLDSATEIEITDLPTFGLINRRQVPLRVQLGARLQY